MNANSRTGNSDKTIPNNGMSHSSSICSIASFNSHKFVLNRETIIKLGLYNGLKAITFVDMTKRNDTNGHKNTDEDFTLSRLKNVK